MICLVTGGTSGIGEAIAEALSDKGHKVYATGRNPKQEKRHDNFLYTKMDVQSDDSVKACIDEIINKESQIDIVVNCAGLGIAGPIEETHIDDIKNVFETNFYGIVRVCQAVLPYMRKRKSGQIINISSIASEMGLPFRAYYSASKAAVDVFTEALRMELKPFNIKAYIVQPGDFNTNISANRNEVNENTTSPYHATYERVRSLVNEEVGNSGNPKDVGIKIAHLISKNNPGIRYKVGPFMQKIAPKIKKIVPEKLFEKLIMNNYKI